MADQNSAAHLYSLVTKLAYTETQMAIHPRPPFAVSDRSDLAKQAKKLADCAANFRQKDPKDIDQQRLFNAVDLVTTAQAMFDFINKQVANTLTKQVVYTAVDAAVDAVNVS